MKRPDQRGFSLIELMVAVVIIGVLTAIAVPSYRSYIVKSSRASAQNQLLKLASLQEKIYLNSSAYTANLTTAYNGNTTGGLGITSGKSDDGRYTFAIEQSGQQYQISATPVAGTTQVGDGCMVILESGLRAWFKGDDAPCVAPPPFTGYTAW